MTDRRSSKCISKRIQNKHSFTLFHQNQKKHIDDEPCMMSLKRTNSDLHKNDCCTMGNHNLSCNLDPFLKLFLTFKGINVTTYRTNYSILSHSKLKRLWSRDESSFSLLAFMLQSNELYLSLNEWL